MLNTEDRIAQLEEQDKLNRTSCEQCGHIQCLSMIGNTVCALCYEGRNCTVADRESRKI